MSFTEKAYFCKDHFDVDLVMNPEAGDLVCPECGTVVGERVMDVCSEWQTIPSAPSSSETNQVSTPGSEGMDRDLEMPEIFDLYCGKLGVFNRRYLSASSRNLINRYKDAANLAEFLKLPVMIFRNARSLLERVNEERSVICRPAETIVAACMYIACRQGNVPRTLKDICAKNGANKACTVRCFKSILRLNNINLTVLKSDSFMAQFFSELKFNAEAQTVTVHLVQKVTELGLDRGRAPTTITSACMYMASCYCRLGHSAKDVGRVTGVAAATILNIHEILEQSEVTFPANNSFPILENPLPSP
ncbi:hypothetical protein ACOME3_000594 [Neoechinorhynchus agilis]